jgi:hypothetical protein
VAALSSADSLKLPGGLYAGEADQALTGAVARHVALSRGSGKEAAVARVRVLVDGPARPGLARSAVRGLGGLHAAVEFTLRHPVDALVTGDLASWPEVLALAAECGHRFLVRRTSRFLGFTLNPYLPLLDPRTGLHSFSALPARPFLDVVRARLMVPCTDIVLEGPGKLEAWLADAV